LAPRWHLPVTFSSTAKLVPAHTFRNYNIQILN